MACPRCMEASGLCADHEASLYDDPVSDDLVSDDPVSDEASVLWAVFCELRDIASTLYQIRAALEKAARK